MKQVKSELKFENLFFYTLDMSIDVKSLDKLKKSIKQFLYNATEGNRSIWFGTMFPYMIMEGNEGILFSAISKYCRCHFLS